MIIDLLLSSSFLLHDTVTTVTTPVKVVGSIPSLLLNCNSVRSVHLQCLWTCEVEGST